jgi:hypothetical protein
MDDLKAKENKRGTYWVFMRYMNRLGLIHHDGAAIPAWTWHIVNLGRRSEAHGSWIGYAFELKSADVLAVSAVHVIHLQEDQE